ncbi:kinase-like domain-containing protein [Chytriomyces cf. hyalinus JEL632]|nr:kinase-like domain-containing protein [Chytriomyces cf. hyalinus JEL632]
MTLPIKLLSQYTLHHPLGEGSTGFVVSGTRNLDRVQVAVKFMFKDRIPMGQGGWKRDYELNCVVPMEVFIMRRLEHENIVQFYDVFEDSVFVYIVMEAVKHISYVQPTPNMTDHGPSTPPLSPITYPAHVIPLKDPDDPSSIHDETASTTSSRSTSQTRSVPREPYQGAKRRAHSKDLFDYIERKPRMSEGVTRLIFKQIADAIAYLHSRGFVHRDIKDENVIIDDSMKVKVIDFGASRSIPKSRTDYFWDFVGTLTYAPPECIPFSAGVALEPHRGPEQDVWSLGVLLFILLETRPPFPANSTREARTRRPILTTSRTDALKDLLFGMLDPVQETRMTIEAVTAHPWFLTMPTMPMANIPRGPCI